MTQGIALAANAEAVTERDAEVELVRRAARGDGDAFDRLAARHWPALVRLARVVQASDEEAEDLAQETLAKAWTGLARLRDPARFVPWMRRMLVRDAVLAARRRRARSSSSVELESDVARSSTGDEPGARLEIAAPTRRTPRLLIATLGAGVAALAVALLAPSSGRERRPASPPAPAATRAPEQRLIVIELASGTRLYVALTPAHPSRRTT